MSPLSLLRRFERSSNASSLDLPCLFVSFRMFSLFSELADCFGSGFESTSLFSPIDRDLLDFIKIYEVLLGLAKNRKKSFPQNFLFTKNLLKIFDSWAMSFGVMFASLVSVCRCSRAREPITKASINEESIAAGNGVFVRETIGFRKGKRFKIFLWRPWSSLFRSKKI